MKKTLQQKLFKKYPKIFRQKDLSLQETSMCWGISAGNGWYWLIDNLCQAIQNHVDTYTFNKGERIKRAQVEAIQVKEKFGGLRFYVNSADDQVYGMISFAEEMSYNICESCGSTDSVTQNKKGWISSLCKKCRKEK